MSLYSNYEKTYDVYQIGDSDDTKKGQYPATPTFTIKLNIIRRNEDALAIAGVEYGEYVANANGKYANASRLKKTDKVIGNDGTYIIVNDPKYVRLFDRYKVILNSSK